MKGSLYLHEKHFILQNLNIVALFKVPQPGIADLDIVAYLNTLLQSNQPTEVELDYNSICLWEFCNAISLLCN